MAELKIIFLGTSAAVPTFERGLSSIALLRGNELMVFDAGEGMQSRFLKAKLPINKKMKIFVTHMHGDHCIGLLGLLQTLSIMGREKPIEIFGEPILEEFINENRRIIKFNINYEIITNKIYDEGVVLNQKEYQIKTCKSDHSTSGYCYCLEEFKRPGIFLIDEAKAAGIPEGKLYSYLQHGQDVEFNGKRFLSNEFTGKLRKGRKIGISGDTRPSKHLENFFKNCDVLIFESTFMHNEQKKAIESFHSTALEAALLAKKAKVKKLVLTHFSTRYKDLSVIEAEAKQKFEDVHVARDLDVITVPYDDYN